jgi:hypothetical protein
MHEMTAVGLITPTYSLDLERCAMLCESVDRYVTSFSHHYLIVPDEELEMFARFNGGRRLVMPLSEVLPPWLRPLPRFILRKRRRYWWSVRTKPVSGWHVQQFAKIATASRIPETVSCVLDSDVVFFQPFDAAAADHNNRLPLFVRPREVTEATTSHASWVRSTHRLLGLATPTFPADDFIGHIIFWNQRAVRAMTARIEQVTGLDWVAALCHEHKISEYMLYGNFVRDNPSLLREHILTAESPCLSYWETTPLDEADLERLLYSAVNDYVAFSAQSFSGTPVSSIRAVLRRMPERNGAVPDRFALPTAKLVHTADSLSQRSPEANTAKFA